MKKSKFILLFLLTFTLNKAQQTKNIQAFYNYAFSQDSLKGFDEAAATKAAISEQFLGEELQVRMYQVKREYINAKYHLISQAHIATNTLATALSKTVSPSCLNSDFESSTAGTITASNQIAGWTVGRGTHYPGPSGANSCNLLGYNNSTPVESELIVAPNGIVDPNIGSIYPIYSVFGTSAGDPAAETNNPQLSQGMFGNNFIRINSSAASGADFGIEKISKKFIVSQNSTLFQFAYILVINSGHGCCDAAAFQVKLFNSSSNSIITCPTFSLASLNCPFVSTGINLLTAITGMSATAQSNLIFNKWKVCSVDLSPFVGDTITIEATANDCTGGGHFAYAYFDAQCTNFFASLNGNNYKMQNDTINLFACSANNNSVCIMEGFGPYSWQGPNLQPNYTAYNYPNRCVALKAPAIYTVNIGYYTCNPSKYLIKLNMAPSLQATSTDTLICNGANAVLFVNGDQHHIKWSTGDTTNYVIVSPSVTTVYSVYSKDIYGCSKTSFVAIIVQDCTSLNFQSSEENNYHIYPNPNNGEFMITSTKSSGVGDFVIENALGQMVFRQTLSMGDNPIKTKNLASGLYYYSIYHAGVLVQKGKLKIN